MDDALLEAYVRLEVAARGLWDEATDHMIDSSLFAEDGMTVTVSRRTWDAFLGAVLPFVDHEVGGAERSHRKTPKSTTDTLSACP